MSRTSWAAAECTAATLGPLLRKDESHILDFSAVTTKNQDITN